MQHYFKGKPTSTAYSWSKMIERCNNKNHIAYHRYGGRGITVCDRWIYSFKNFYEDMGERPKNTVLDRIDNNGIYCKENCRWVDRKTSSNNISDNKIIEYNGIKKTMIEWSRHVGINRTTIDERIKRGWSIHKALTTPIINGSKY